jgi:hypothetical protein
MRTSRWNTRRSIPGAALLAVLALAGGASGAEPGEEAADALRQPFFEGVPYALASALPPEACPVLAGWLDDPAEAPWHANAVAALGMADCAGAYDALVAYEARAGSGEVDRTAYRALRTVPVAMGYLAAREDRALAWLLARTSGPPTAPAWRFRNQQGDALARAERSRAVDALALSGRPAAARRLQTLAVQAPDAAGRQHAAQALELLETVQQGGPAAVPGLPGAGGDAR